MHQAQCLAEWGTDIHATTVSLSVCLSASLSYCRTPSEVLVSLSHCSPGGFCSLPSSKLVPALPQAELSPETSTSQPSPTKLFWLSSWSTWKDTAPTRLGCCKRRSRFPGQGENCLFFLSLRSNLFLIEVRSQTSQTHPSMAAIGCAAVGFDFKG